MARKIPWIGTNWKMNKLRADAVGFANTLKAAAILLQSRSDRGG